MFDDIRVCLETSPSNLSSLENLIIPEKFLLTLDFKPSMKYDSGKEDSQRLLIFFYQNKFRTPRDV